MISFTSTACDAEVVSGSVLILIIKVYKMKLKELLKAVTIQGDVRISVWDDDDEIEVTEVLAKDHLTSSDVRNFLNHDVKYVFAGLDNMLHIELNLDKFHLIHSR